MLDARLLEDGRIAALVATSNAQTGDLILFTVLRRNGGHLCIDEEQVVEAAMIASPATPVP